MVIVRRELMTKLPKYDHECTPSMADRIRRWLIAGCMVIALGMVATVARGQSSFVPPSGLVSWWSGNETTSDTQGENHGALVNGSAYALTNIGTAFSFDGQDDYFLAPTAGLSTGNAARTLELWVKVKAFHDGEVFIAGYGHFGFDNQTYSLGVEPIGGKWKLFFSQWGETVMGPALEPQRWYHLAVSNVSNTATVYLNGDAVSTGTLTINTPPDMQFAIGRIPGSYGAMRKLDGLVNNVRIYNRALAAGEIKAIYFEGCQANAPVNVSPVADSTGVALAPILKASDFSNPYPARTHQTSQWQVRLASSPADYSIKVHDQTTASPELTSVSLPSNILKFYTSYDWRVRYQGDNGVWSDWSNETWFETTYVGSTTPINLAPINGEKRVSLTPTFQASPFYAQHPGKTHQASQWQVRETNSPEDYSVCLFDSGSTPTDLTSTTLPLSLLNFMTSCHWRVRYQDSAGNWTPWSRETEFTTFNGNYKRATFLPVGGQIEDVLLDETRNRFWILRKDASRVEAYQLESGQLLASIQTGLQPESFAMTYDRKHLGVGSRGNIYLTVIDLDGDLSGALGKYQSGDKQKVFRVTPLGNSDLLFITRPDSFGSPPFGGGLNVWNGTTKQVEFSNRENGAENFILGLPPSNRFLFAAWGFSQGGISLMTYDRASASAIWHNEFQAGTFFNGSTMHGADPVHNQFVIEHYLVDIVDNQLVMRSPLPYHYANTRVLFNPADANQAIMSPLSSTSLQVWGFGHHAARL